MINDRATILIADDDQGGREAIKALLFSQGYLLIEAEDGLQAVQQAQEHVPDLILLDVMMPGMNGFEVCRRLRSDAILGEIPILMITLLDDRDSLLQGLEAGADDFISKPFDRVALRARIATIIRLNRYRRLLVERKRGEEERATYSRQLRELSEASLQINAAHDNDEILSITAHYCGQITAARYSFITLREDESKAPNIVAMTLKDHDSGKSLAGTIHRVLSKTGTYQALVDANEAIKQSRSEKEDDPFWEKFRAALQRRNTRKVNTEPEKPINGWLAALLSGRNGQNIGAIFLFDKPEGEFSDNDLSILVQIAQIVSVALGKMRLINEIQEASVHIRELARQVLSAQENERKIIARELHDESGQVLAFLQLTLQMMLDDIPDQLTTVRGQIGDLVQLTEKLSVQTRTLALSLRPPVIDLGLNAGLEGLCLDFSRRLKIPIHYSGCDFPQLPEPISITFYRLLQEGLTNIARHAAAAQVSVELAARQGLIELTIADDGKGFDPDQKKVKWGAGLKGMEERLELLNGWLTIESAPGQGARLVAHVPWSEN